LAKWQPAPDTLIRQFERALQAVPAAQARKMFGYPAAFLNGHMLAGLFQDTMMLRLSPEDCTTFLRQPGAAPFEPMPGRQMREYVVVPAAMVSAPAALAKWLQRAVAYVNTLPPKVAKARRKKPTK